MVTYAKVGVRGADADHAVAWLPAEGWFCDCGAKRQCRAIRTVLEALSGSVSPVKLRTRRGAGAKTLEPE